jgi:hypothetical protein
MKKGNRRERKAHIMSIFLFFSYFAKFWVKHWNWKYGNCFTFNPGGNETGHKLGIIHTSGTGPNHGMWTIFKWKAICM